MCYNWARVTDKITSCRFTPKKTKHTFNMLDYDNDMNKFWFHTRVIRPRALYLERIIKSKESWANQWPTNGPFKLTSRKFQHKRVVPAPAIIYATCGIRLWKTLSICKNFLSVVQAGKNILDRIVWCKSFVLKLCSECQLGGLWLEL